MNDVPQLNLTGLGDLLGFGTVELWNGGTVEQTLTRFKTLLRLRHLVKVESD